ncbi:MAG: cupredoxin domain-containing protein [Burkholderiales bacterium]|nr:cupredoxin domain-containing protein [Sulfuricellaceae bacterium]
MERRVFLKKMGVAGLTSAAAATGLLSWPGRSYAASVSKTYYITSGNIVQPDGVSVFFKGFSDSSTTLAVPATPMVVGQGDTVTVTIVNTLTTTHSFVIDGVVDSGSIAGGQTKTVSFTPNTAGTYLFYDKLNAPYNRVVGLHGGFAVMPLGSSNQLYAGSLTFVNQLFWVFNDIDPAWNTAVQNGTTPTTAYKPRYFTINGLSSRPPGAAGNGDPTIDAMANLNTKLVGSIGDAALVRMLNAGMGSNAVHCHGNHFIWLTKNGQIIPNWRKDVLNLSNSMGKIDAIYPFEAPPDAYPPVTSGTYPMHLHNEMTQTAGGGLYLFGAMTDIEFI